MGEDLVGDVTQELKLEKEIMGKIRMDKVFRIKYR
jgi:hypothetical protein